MYTWHFTFDGQQAVHDLAAAYQARLAALPALDMVPARWLHLTTQGVGFTDEMTDDEVTAIVDAAAERLKTFGPQEVMLGPARVTPEAILLDVAPADGLAGIRGQLREAITNVLGAGRLMETDQWTAHVTVAYSSGTGPSAPYLAALDGHATADSLISDVQLIVLNRDQRMYEWMTRAAVHLSGSPLRLPYAYQRATPRQVLDRRGVVLRRVDEHRSVGGPGGPGRAGAPSASTGRRPGGRGRAQAGRRAGGRGRAGDVADVPRDRRGQAEDGHEPCRRAGPHRPPVD
jgi:hypothetical protein